MDQKVHFVQTIDKIVKLSDNIDSSFIILKDWRWKILKYTIKFFIIFLLLALYSGVSAGNEIDDDFISPMGDEIWDETPMVLKTSGNSENNTALEPSGHTLLSSLAGRVFIATKIIGLAGISMAVILSREKKPKKNKPSSFY